VARLELFRAIAACDTTVVARIIHESPRLAVGAIGIGATRADATTYFLTEIQHYVYRGDTGLHIASAAYDRATSTALVAQGADVRARNRRGAEPLHYAADGTPGGTHWNPRAQRAIIEYLVAMGADADARDRNGVAPLHRAVRTRCSAAVGALLDNGADPRAINKAGSTPFHLAVQSTGRGDSGSDAAKAQQRGIIALLLEHGARPTDTDSRGKTVEAAAASDWVRALLNAPRDVPGGTGGAG
jgi:hypothetical protein